MNYALGLEHGYPGMQWSIQGNDYSTLEWNAGNAQPKPSEADIQAAYNNYVTASTTEATEQIAANNTMLTALNGLVDKTWDEMTTAQRSLLIRAVAYKNGVFNRQLKVKPLNQWLFSNGN